MHVLAIHVFIGYTWKLLTFLHPIKCGKIDYMYFFRLLPKQKCKYINYC